MAIEINNDPGLEFQVGDEVWWFKTKTKMEGLTYGFSLNIPVNAIELVHDQIKEIDGDTLTCWHSTKRIEDIWGKTRFEAWSRLKEELEKWGALDGTS